MTEVGQSGRSTRPGRPGSVGDMGDSESRGRWITFESGPVANHNVFTHLYIFNGEVSSGGRGQGGDLGRPLRGSCN